MMVTRLMEFYISKGKSLTQNLSDHTDYSLNLKKTDDGKYVSSYECTHERWMKNFCCQSVRKKCIGIMYVWQLIRGWRKNQKILTS